MERKVQLTENTARRMAAATIAFERSGRDQPPIHFRNAGDDGEPIRLGKTTSTWTKGTTATIDLWEGGTPGSETQAGTLAGCVNKFANVAGGKWVAVARGPLGAFYLIAAEC
jgi:hypothetical protein